MIWRVKAFDELSLRELYAMLALRAEVFVVEQDCPYQDLDGKDQKSWHVMGWKDDELVAVARIVDKGVSYAEYYSIGRVVVSEKVRKDGIGSALMEEAINWIYSDKGEVPIKISAQCYLIKFYGALGFQPVGEEYLEDNIPHIAMLKEI